MYFFLFFVLWWLVAWCAVGLVWVWFEVRGTRGCAVRVGVYSTGWLVRLVNTLRFALTVGPARGSGTAEAGRMDRVVACFLVNSAQHS